MRKQIPVHTPGEVGFTDQLRSEFDTFYRIAAILTTAYKRPPKPKLVQQLFEEVLVSVFAHTIRTGTFRLPAKIGSLRLSRRRPTYYMAREGKTGRRPPNVSLIYSEGEAVVMALGRLKGFTATRKPPKLVRVVRDHEIAQVAANVTLTRADLEALLKGHPE